MTMQSYTDEEYGVLERLVFNYVAMEPTASSLLCKVRSNREVERANRAFVDEIASSPLAEEIFRDARKLGGM